MTETVTNPLLGPLKLPGRIFQLPSRGLFYRNGELSPTVKDGEIHVQPLSALDEITLKNPDQLFSGSAVDGVFKSCISGIEKPSELLAKDVDAIMMFLRTVTYGPNYEFTAKHNCAGAKEHSYIADVDTMIGRMKLIDPTELETMYTVNMPNQQVVKLVPNRYSSMIELVKLNQAKTEISVEDQRRNLLLMLLAVVDSVDGVSDKKSIEEWASKLPMPYVNLIAKRTESINDWGADTIWVAKCRDCGESFQIDIPINPVSFFTE